MGEHEPLMQQIMIISLVIGAMISCVYADSIKMIDAVSAKTSSSAHLKIICMNIVILAVLTLFWRV